MDRARAVYFSGEEQEIIIQKYEEYKHVFQARSNTVSDAKAREECWRKIADCVNAQVKQIHSILIKNHVYDVCVCARVCDAFTIRLYLFRELNQRISAQTVRNRLREAYLHARRPHRGLDLTAVRRRNQLEWANAHIRWRLELWRGVLFMDESRF